MFAPIPIGGQFHNHTLLRVQSYPFIEMVGTVLLNGCPAMSTHSSKDLLDQDPEKYWNGLL